MGICILGKFLCDIQCDGIWILFGMIFLISFLLNLSSLYKRGGGMYGKVSFCVICDVDGTWILFE